MPMKILPHMLLYKEVPGQLNFRSHPNAECGIRTHNTDSIALAEFSEYIFFIRCCDFCMIVAMYYHESRFQ